MSDLTVIVPTYRSKETLNFALWSMAAYAPAPLRIIVVNNYPPDNDDLGRMLKNLPYDQAELICYGDNLWDAESVRRTFFGRVDTAYVACLHDDVLFVPGQWNFWQRLVHLAGWQEVGIAGPSSNNAAEYQDIRHIEAPEFAECAFIHGMCQVFRSEVYRDLGGHDPDHKVSDVDISLKAHQAGYKCICDRGAFLVHQGGQTQKRGYKDHGEYLSQITLWLEEATVWLVQRHGVAAVYDLFSRSSEVCSQWALWGWQPAKVEAMMRARLKPPLWEPTSRHVEERAAA